jgi:hypothetical protein
VDEETPLKPRAWTVEIAFSEVDAKTRADAVLTWGPDGPEGWGRARRRPVDADGPAIGEQISAASASASDEAHVTN